MKTGTCLSNYEIILEGCWVIDTSLLIIEGNSWREGIGKLSYDSAIIGWSIRFYSIIEGLRWAYVVNDITF